MASSRPIFVTRAAQQFRAIMRPDMFGHIGNIEPLIAVRAADELNDWLFSIVREAIRETDIDQRRGEMLKQLMGGIRVYGRASLAQLRGQITVQPWIFPHEFGAHITPKGGSKYLTIPFGYALRPDGSPKFRSARSWQRFGSFVMKSKTSDKLFIVYKAASGELRYLYTLVESVDIPARLNLNRIGDARLGELLAAWGRIYLQQVGRMPEIFTQWLKGI